MPVKTYLAHLCTAAQADQLYADNYEVCPICETLTNDTSRRIRELEAERDTASNIAHQLRVQMAKLRAERTGQDPGRNELFRVFAVYPW